jgi:hypothetical protein
MACERAIDLRGASLFPGHSLHVQQGNPKKPITPVISRVAQSVIEFVTEKMFDVLGNVHDFESN